MAAGGYFGSALLVDLAEGGARSERLPLPDEILRAYLGGVGLGTWLLYRLAPPGLDPLAPAAPLAFVFSPLVGTPMTTSAKFAVVAKSPLTGLLCDALASGQFAIAGKLTGHDALVLTGRAPTLSAVRIDGDRVDVEAVPELAGCPAAEAERRLADRHGRGWRIAAIGPAGERGVRYATISHGGRHAGRGGLGAVLGAKRIKAVLVRARTKTPLADPAGVLARARELRARSAGPALAAIGERGTLGNLLIHNEMSTLPTRNFTAATFPAAARLDPDELRTLRATTRRGCATCTIGCEHIYARRDGGHQRAEYQSSAALGPLCGVADPDAVLDATARCDELGIDTISAGATIAWAMECAERGLIDAGWLRFGDPDAVLRALAEIGDGTGLGPLLAEGTRRAADAVGGGSISFAAQIKGMEMPGYEPRTMQAAALGLAVNARGADHNRSGAQEADLSAAVDRLAADSRHVTAAIDTENRAAVMDSMILCNFLRAVFADPFAEWAALLTPVTGWDLDEHELLAIAARIVDLKRRFNLREGATADDDTLPARFLSSPAALASGDEATLTEQTLHALVRSYYAARGWDTAGRPA